jgi:hypothetical protein|tara:strand:- start:58 stop:234 length:177 start_codon:yes stop_codon:yes gene_type:complete
LKGAASVSVDRGATTTSAECHVEATLITLELAPEISSNMRSNATPNTVNIAINYGGES